MKKFLSILFVSLLICSACIHPVAASAPSITIDGGEVAGGGVASGPNAKGDVVALLASLALASQGVKVSVAEDSNFNPIEFIKKLLIDYAEKGGMIFEDLCDQWLSNVRIFADGLISIGMDNSQRIYQFLSWLKESNSIVVDSSGDYILIDGNMCPIVYPGQQIEICVGSPYNQTLPLYYKNTTNKKYGLFFSYYNNSRYFLTGVTNEGGNFGGVLIVNGNNVQSFNESMSKVNNIYVAYKRVHPYDDLNPLKFSIPVINGHPQEIVAGLNGFNIESGKPENDSLIGDSNNVNPDDFNISDNKINILNPGLDLDALALQSGLDGILKIKEYLQALINAVNGVDDNVIRVNDSITGVLEDIPIPDYDIFNSTTVDTQDESQSEGGMTIIDNNSLPDQEATQQYLKHMQFNLINIFPFCIPFDIFNLLSKLDVTPVTPHVHLSFPNPVLNEPLEFDLDFSQWDGVASTVRHMELFAFVIGLALVTRNIIRG